MSTQVKRRRGTAAENAAFTGALGEITYLTDTKRLAAHDATTAGGAIFPNAADMLTGAMTRATATGTDTYAITLPYFPASYSSGLEVDVTFTNANTTTCTLNVNGVGAAGMKDETGTNFTAGQIAAGSRYTFRHNGSEWRRVSGASGSIKVVKRQVFNASGTYTPSTGMLYCDVEAKGGGGTGGNGGGGSSTRGSGGGGGEGAKSLKTLSAADVGASQTVTIASAGGTTSLGSLVTAVGGSDGDNGGNDNGGSGGDGGATGTGDKIIPGACGSSGQTCGSLSGNGGSGGGNGGGKGGRSSSLNGSSAVANSGGGGGGGAGNSGTGGTGSSGYLIITEYCSQ